MQVTEYFPRDMFSGKTVFITGGGSGINLGIAKNFAALGANVAICGRTQAKLETAAAELRSLGAKAAAYACDVRDYDALHHAIEQTRSDLGAIDTLICGAAGNFPCPAEGLSANGFKSVIDIDLLGSFNACRAAVDQLKKTRGSVLFISANQAFIPTAFQCHVGAAKAGIDNLMKNLAFEWGTYGIRCNCVAPGPIAGTEGVDRLMPETLQNNVQGLIPIGRMGTVDDIGQAAVFLASPLATFITGCVLVVDGGQHLPGSGLMQRAIVEAMQ